MMPAPRTGPRVIGSGDLVIAYEGFDKMKAVYVAPRGQLQNKYGLFRHDDWLGKTFGIKVFDTAGRGWMYLLEPTPELWSLVLPHRTQILYLADIAFIVSTLELAPGAIVLESGTGSGSLTHALVRAVAPTGHVHTFDFHEVRAGAARSEFGRHGLGATVTVRTRDVEATGFPAELDGMADAVFLDLPGPWRAVPAAARSLRPGASLCSFSPCIEQVQRTCEALGATGFTDIRTIEVLLRPYDVRSQVLSMDALGDERRGGGGRDGGGGGRGRKRGRRGEPGGGAGGAQAVEADGGGALPEGGEGAGSATPGAGDGPAAEAVPAVEAAPVPPRRMTVAVVQAETRGHTGYLTFAYKAL